MNDFSTATSAPGQASQRTRLEGPRLAQGEATGAMPVRAMDGHIGSVDSGNEDELAKIDRLISGKPESPERIYNWLDTHMSIARFYGGLTYLGHRYFIAFHEANAPLVRADVLEREAKAAKAKARLEKIANAGLQSALL